jgi:uncharacterized protein DUF2154
MASVHTQVRGLAVVSLAVLLGGCAFVATGETRRETMSIDLNKATNVHARLSMGAGELRVKSGTPKLLDGAFAYNVPEWKPVLDYRPDGQLSITQPSHGASAFGNTVYEWDLTLNGDVPIDITASLGAGEANLELGKMNLGRVEVNIGAGEVTVDLRGEPRRNYSVQIRGGVGETTVYLPRDAGISATATKGIGEINVDGLERRDGVWLNPDRVNAPVTVRLDVKGGIGEIRLIR